MTWRAMFVRPCFEGFSNSLCILQGDNAVSISDAASQHMGLTWNEPIVRAHSALDGVPDARWVGWCGLTLSIPR